MQMRVCQCATWSPSRAHDTEPKTCVRTGRINQLFVCVCTCVCVYVLSLVARATRKNAENSTPLKRNAEKRFVFEKL